MSGTLLSWLRRGAPAPNGPFAEPFPASRVLRPAWPLLGKASALLRPYARAASGARAWEACASAGMIPAEWVGGGREFVDPLPGGDGTESLPHPPSPRAAVAFAAGAGDVALAEQLLQEHRAAVAPWLPARDEPAGPVRWYAGLAPLPGLWRVGAVGVPHRAAEAAVRGARREAGSEAGRARFARLAARGAGDDSLRDVLEWRLGLDLALADTWRAAVSYGLSVPDDGRALGGRPFASLPDPYAPLVAIWGLGLSASLSGEVDLVMPAWNVGAP